MDPGEQFARDLLAQFPHDWETRCELVDTLFLRGDLSGSIAVIEDAPEMPVDNSHLYKLVEVYAAAHSHTAVALLKGILANDPDDAKAHLASADVYATLGNGARAREHYRSALRIRPEFRDKSLESRIGIQPGTPTVRMVPEEQIRPELSQATSPHSPVAHPDRVAGSSRRASSRSRRPNSSPRAPRRSRNDGPVVALVLAIAFGAALLGGFLFLQLM